MNFQKRTAGIIIILIIAVAIGVFSYWYAFKIQKETTETGKIELPEEEEIISFEECVAKGYPILDFPPILESYPRQCRTPDGRTFVEELQRETDGGEASWRVCSVPYDVNEIMNSFDCPVWMQNIDWDRTYQDDTTAKFHFYNSLDQETQRAYFSKKTGAVAFMIENIEADDQGNYKGFNKIKFIYLDREITNLYTNNLNIYWEKLGDIKFSPDGKYISFILYVYDGQRNTILDVNTGNDILADYDIYCRLDEMVWSSNGKYIAINNDINSYAGEGSESVFIGDVRDMTEGGRLTKVFEVEPKEYSLKGKQIDKLNFGQDDKDIYFSVVVPEGGLSAIDLKGNLIEEVRYKYNISNQELLVE